MFEVSTLYTGGSSAEFAGPWESMVKPMLRDAGAHSALAWEGLTGAFAGATAISTRWESLNAIGNWLGQVPARLAENDDLAQVVASSTLVMRVIGKDLVEQGETHGQYLAASRYSFNGTPVGVGHAADVSMGAGANGVRIAKVITGGEWSGQIIGAMYIDDLDVFDRILEATAADDHFVSNVQAGGGQLQSRTIFRRIG